MSALTRIAASEHRKVEIEPGDLVIISASPIPGNEKSIFKVINELFKKAPKSSMNPWPRSMYRGMPARKSSS
jgi:Predicted hydrolase of the metallo-beta-lactamase superfamily